MAFKVFALICLVAVASINAAPEPVATNEIAVQKTAQVVPQQGGLLGGLLGGVLGAVGGLLGGVLNGTGSIVNGLLGNGIIDGNKNKADLGLNLPGLLQVLGGGVGNITGSLGNVLRDLSKLKIPGTLDDVLNLVTGVGATVGGVLNSLLPGVGAPVGNLVLGLVKILICALGSPGLTGNLLGDSRPGIKNPQDIPAICKPNYGSKYGLKSYDGKNNNIDDVYAHYNLGDIDDKLRKALDKYTNGQGLDGLEGSQYYVIKWILDLSSLVKSRGKSGNWSKKDTTTVITTLAKILGALGNGYKNNLGKRLVIQLLKYLKDTTKNDSYFKNIDWDKYKTSILRDISNCKQDDFGGAFKKQNGDDYKNVQNDHDVVYNYGGNQDTTGDVSNVGNQDTTGYVDYGENQDTTGYADYSGNQDTTGYADYSGNQDTTGYADYSGNQDTTGYADYIGNQEATIDASNTKPAKGKGHIRLVNNNNGQNVESYDSSDANQSRRTSNDASETINQYTDENGASGLNVARRTSGQTEEISGSKVVSYKKIGSAYN